MKKRSLLVLMVLAIGAFVAHSPDAIRMALDRLRGTAGTTADNHDVADVPTTGTSKAADESGFVGQIMDGHTNSGSGGNAFAKDTDPAAQTEKIIRAVAEIPDGELRQALERSLQDDSPSEYRELLQRRWAEINPSAAATWASAITDPSKAIPVLQQSAIVWANRDMPAVVQWVDSLPQGEGRTAAVIALGYEASRSLSFDALNLVVGLDPSLERDSVLEQMAREWSASDANQALAWVNQVPDATLRDHLLSALAISAAGQDAESAAAVASTELKPGPNQNRTAVAIVQRWAQTDPDATAAWVEAFPESDVKTSAKAAIAEAQTQ